jgi:mRNA-degrading endonuclease HigB of HigAB toxin-antitoxin module
MCSFSQQNSVYSNILSPNVLHNLKAMYIPGGEPNDSLLIQSGDKINEDFQNGTTNGIYMCSCNLYYNIGGCGFPMVTQICRNCGKLIGGTNHKLIQREGHFRVFKDENQRRNDYYVINYHFYVPYIVLSELMNKVENERRIQIRGLKRVKRNFYIDNKKKVRNISTVTYRILSFIFYSCIYADIKIGYLSTSDLEKFYYSDVNNNANNNNSLDNLLSVMMDNYNSLIKELKIRGIENIQ